MAKASNKPIKPKQTKSQIYTTISTATGVSKKDVGAVVEALADVARRHLIKGGAGEFVVPAIGVKVRAIQKPATKARKGRNPFTGEEITIKAKPARLDVRARALKTLKDAVSLARENASLVSLVQAASAAYELLAYFATRRQMS